MDVQASPPTFLVGPTAFEKTRVYALAIAHDANHSKLYHLDYKKTPLEMCTTYLCLWSGRKAEIECNKFADSANKKMKGSFLSKWLNKQNTLYTRIIPHENVPLEKRYW